MVAPSEYRPERNYSWLHTPAHRQVSGVKCELGLDERGAVSVRVASPAELADVEVLHDGAQLLSFRREKKETKLASPFTWQGQLPLNRQGRLNWGAYAARAVTADGRVATSLPVLVERPAEADVTLGLWTFDADEGSDALDSSPWLHDGRLGGRPRRPPWQPQRVPDAWDGKCLQFDGVDDRVLLDGPIVPPNAYTVECWIKPEAPPDGSKGQILFATANAAVVLMLGQKGELRAVRRSSEQWHQVSDGKPIPPNQWQHVAVTYDGSVLRLYHNGVLVAEKPAPGDARCGQVSLGYNSVTEGAFYRGLMDEVRLSARALPPDEFGPHNPLSGRR
ncbi:MAG: LamG domain-containing protein [Planctomycetes bacterium]|nr:LamG domain-containing protein [Planctomycetota bacterium]